MAGKDIIMATQEELKKLHVVRKAVEKSITQNDAAEILDLTDRQIRRIAARIELEGDAGVIHKLRGKSSNRALPGKNRVLRLFKAKYPDFGPTLASEKLLERDNIKVNDETLRLWLIKEGVPYKKRKGLTGSGASVKNASDRWSRWTAPNTIGLKGGVHSSYSWDI